MWLISGCLTQALRSREGREARERREGREASRGKGFLIAGYAALLVVTAGEVALWWALAKTYSRGGWMAVAGAALVWLLSVAWRWRRGARAWHGHPARLAEKVARASLPVSVASPRGTGFQPVIRSGADVAPASVAPPLRRGAGVPPASGSRLAFPPGAIAFALRIAIAMTCLFASSFADRLTPAYTREDRSALNRVDLWKGGLELVADSPLHGWGRGQSGASFMHWTQQIGRDEGYLSMVNSYLTVAVEAGLPLFTLCSLPPRSFRSCPACVRPTAHPAPPPTGLALPDSGAASPPPRRPGWLQWSSATSGSFPASGSCRASAP
ncbi:MAG: O-antigen ligase family protein [Opitutaceae bacterium]|nr:O-antigen ligase family protein [Opitutaceae bacterium]